MAKKKQEKPIIAQGYEPVKRKDGTYAYRTQVTILGTTEREIFGSFGSTRANLQAAKTWKEKKIALRNEMKISGTTFTKSMLFNDLCDKFMGSRTGTKESTKKTYKSAIDKHLRPRYGEMQIKDIKKIHGATLQGDLEAAYHSAGGINKIMQQFSAIFDYAVKTAEIIDKNPISGIKKMKVDKLDYQYWTLDQAAKFLKDVSDHFYCNLFRFALNTGLRRGEICGLRWKNVTLDGDNSRLSFNEQLTPDMLITTVKGHTMRSIPIAPGAVAVLEELTRGGDDDFVFTAPNGGPIRPDTLSKQFRKAQIDLGRKKLIKFHALRHTFGTYLGTLDIGIRKIQELMGHKDMKITERYMHVSSKDQQDAIKNVNF